MAFKFNWNFFNTDELYKACKTSMTQSIAQARRPPEMSEPLEVVDLHFGKDPPELVLHSLPEVGIQRVHLVFKLKYSGDAHLTLKSRVEANPLKTLLSFQDEFPRFVRPCIVGAQSSLRLPLVIRLYSVQLDTLVDVIYTKHGVVVTFRNDPVKSVSAESSLDVIPGVSTFIAVTIKTALAETFQEDVPEAAFKASSPTLQFPDPYYGARRSSNQYTIHKRFLELGLSIQSQHCNPFGTLSLSAQVEHSIPSRICLKAHKSESKTESQLSVQDLIEMTPSLPSTEASIDADNLTDISFSFDTSSLSSFTSCRQQHKPTRRVINIRKSLAPSAPSTPPPQQQPQQPPPSYTTAPVFESTPQTSPVRTLPPLKRRHSIQTPSMDETPCKIRTASLQPALRPTL